MNLLVLFAGSRSVEKVAENIGFKTFSIDIENLPGVDLVKDIQNLKISDIPFIPDLIWASPDCKTYTIASISKHRNGIEPKSEYAKKCDLVNENMWQIIDYFKVPYFVENPRGMFRKMPFVKDRIRKEVCYCKYGDIRMKPTDIFTNFKQWIPREMCKNFKYDSLGNIIDKHCHHESARRGSKTGTQGSKNNFERSKIPKELIKEILEIFKDSKL